jgi:hypothetical protein
MGIESFLYRFSRVLGIEWAAGDHRPSTRAASSRTGMPPLMVARTGSSGSPVCPGRRSSAARSATVQPASRSRASAPQRGVEVPQPLPLPHPQAVRRVRHQPSRPGRRLQRGERPLLERDVGGHPRALRVRARGVDRAGIAVAPHDRRGGARQHPLARGVHRARPERPVVLRPPLERERPRRQPAPGQPRRDAARDQRRLDRDASPSRRAGPAAARRGPTPHAASTAAASVSRSGAFATACR